VRHAAILLVCLAGVAFSHTTATGASGSSQTAQRDATFEGVVRRVVDGDTIQVARRGGEVVTVRLAEIDCPEAGQAFGRVALLFTRQLIFDKTVTVKVGSLDRNGRAVAHVALDGRDVGLQLIQAGLAWHYTDFSSDAALAAAEKAARSGRRGLWIDANPTPPWVARRRPRATDSARPRAAIEGPFHGNTRSLVYHHPTCKNAGCRNCTAVFKTEQDARVAGYRPAGDCIRR
jgi:endonuclease YncB( thermonuclease family)